MEKGILKQYFVTIFDDGTIATQEIPKISSSITIPKQDEPSLSSIGSQEIQIYSNTTGIDYNKVSSRIGQILKVLNEIEELRKTKYIEKQEIFTTAVKNVAKELEVETASVIDKLSRQLGETAESIREKIFNAYSQNDATELKNLLLAHVSSRNKLKDTEAIHFYFDNIFNYEQITE